MVVAVVKEVPEDVAEKAVANSAAVVKVVAVKVVVEKAVAAKVAVVKVDEEVPPTLEEGLDQTKTQFKAPVTHCDRGF